jgi:hypothetical protein
MEPVLRYRPRFGSRHGRLCSKGAFPFALRSAGGGREYLPQTPTAHQKGRPVEPCKQPEHPRRTAVGAGGLGNSGRHGVDALAGETFRRTRPGDFPATAKKKPRSKKTGVFPTDRPCRAGGWGMDKGGCLLDADGAKRFLHGEENFRGLVPILCPACRSPQAKAALSQRGSIPVR